MFLLFPLLQASSVLSTIQTALQPPPQKPSVAIGEGLEKATLKGLNSECWPSSCFTDKIRDENEKLKSRGITNPFYAADLRSKALAPWAAAAAALKNLNKGLRKSVSYIAV